MKKKLLAVILALCMVLSMVPTAFAASDEATKAADTLYSLGLFKGTGTDANGKPIYDLDRAPNRAESIVMLVRLLGKVEEAKVLEWPTPFTDVEAWAKPFVGYAYTNKYTYGVSDTTFGSTQTISAAQYITFVLRALGYKGGTDFEWSNAWELSDKLGITNGQYNESTSFTRGDAAIVSLAALSAKPKGSDKKLIEVLTSNGVVSTEAAMEAGLIGAVNINCVTSCPAEVSYVVIDKNGNTMKSVVTVNDITTILTPQYDWLGELKGYKLAFELSFKFDSSTFTYNDFCNIPVVLYDSEGNAVFEWFGRIENIRVGKSYVKGTIYNNPIPVGNYTLALRNCVIDQRSGSDKYYDITY